MRTLLFLLLASGCSLHAQSSGVLIGSKSGARMMGDDGRVWRLHPGESAPIFESATGVTVRVEGPRLGHRLWIRSWTITDGGDGSAPFVGTLRRFGSQWLVDDLNSGSTVTLVPESLGDLVEAEGRLVMISGYVVGAHRVNVVRWTLLGLDGNNVEN